MIKNLIKNIEFNILKLKKEIKNNISLINNINDLYILKSKYLGKNSYIKNIINIIKNIDDDIYIKKIGILINNFKNYLLKIINNKKNIIFYKNKIIINNIDPTIKYIEYIGGLHPISINIKKIINIFNKFNFKIIYGNEIESVNNNFNILNIPYNHPSRNTDNTFWINNNFLLRTHTSSIQNKLSNIIFKNKKPIKIISYGKVYRKDKDKTHNIMFHQLDGIYIDTNVSISNLLYLLNKFIKIFFNNLNIKKRFRLSYFPFTNPSIELDILINEKWIEILGAGLINKNVLKKLNINNNIYSGFAFGLGIERLVMSKYNINDIKPFFENNLKFLNQFKYI